MSTAEHFLEPTRTVGELTPDDLELERYLLDLSLQPIERFDGFSHIEQYLLSALRYQLNYTNYALAQAQYNYTPAFTGYLTEAQANTIEKMRDKKVWGYWAHECLVGYQRWDPDPIKFANVMYTGFFGVMIGLFETLNDHRFSRPGALTLRWNDDTEYVYEFNSLCEAIVHNMGISSQTPLYPCEPRLVYPMCNAFSLSTLLMHDRLHGTHYGNGRVEQMAQAYLDHKYLRPDHRFMAARGPFKFFMGPSVGNDGVMSFWLNFAMPEQATKTWENLRENLIRIEDDDVKMDATSWETLDPGNYSRGTGMSRVSVMASAKEHGDNEMADALERSLDKRYETVRKNGARAYTGISSWGNAGHVLSRFTTRNSMAHLLAGEVPAEWKTGPILTQAAYPDVLVARAVTDGRALDMVLQPGNGGGRTVLEIERLAPEHDYLVTGGVEQSVTADQHGRARLSVDLDGRLEVLLRPANP
ncbi:hypothetical protein [Mycolicibacterium sp.]|uniref:linalool dehydratase/isomerase domain-containing protein n=1 Tax=Mycolicibacterium sp. TaxID=2320850 RepID=UPI0028AB8ED0|nr:hypothetical protein [Mycolicibacterium sp.]